jgi:hypothetical protein
MGGLTLRSYLLVGSQTRQQPFANGKPSRKSESLDLGVIFIIPPLQTSPSLPNLPFTIFSGNGGSKFRKKLKNFPERTTHHAGNADKKLRGPGLERKGLSVFRRAPFRCLGILLTSSQHLSPLYPGMAGRSSERVKKKFQKRLIQWLAIARLRLLHSRLCPEDPCNPRL